MNWYPIMHCKLDKLPENEHIEILVIIAYTLEVGGMPYWEVGGIPYYKVKSWTIAGFLAVQHNQLCQTSCLVQ